MNAIKRMAGNRSGQQKPRPTLAERTRAGLARLHKGQGLPPAPTSRQQARRYRHGAPDAQLWAPRRLGPGPAGPSEKAVARRQALIAAVYHAQGKEQ